MTSATLSNNESTILPVLSPQHEVDPELEDKNVPSQCAGTNKWFQIRQKSPWALLYAALIAGLLYGLYAILVPVLVVVVTLAIRWAMYISGKYAILHRRVHKYHPLSQQSEDIRLLQILPGSLSNIIQCVLVTEKLENPHLKRLVIAGL